MGALARRAVLAGLAASGGAMLAGGFSREAAGAPAKLAAIARAKGMRFGSAIDPPMLKQADYAALVLANCNTIVPRNGLKWNATEPRPGAFRFGEGDHAARFSAEHGLTLRGTALVWYRLPDWVKRLEGPRAVRMAMERHIERVMGRYAGRIASWDVVNEAFDYDAATLRKYVFLEQLGEGYIDFAFRTARAVDPKCELVLNETHLFQPGAVYDEKRKAVLALVDRMQTRGTPIDTVGVQGHVRPGLDRIDRDAFAGFCAALRKRGLGVMLSELDASCRFIKALPGFTPADYGRPLAELIDIAAGAGRLTGIIMWGLSPRGLRPSEANSPNPACHYPVNLFDEALRPLPTFEAVKGALEALG